MVFNLALLKEGGGSFNRWGLVGGFRTLKECPGRGVWGPPIFSSTSNTDPEQRALLCHMLPPQCAAIGPIGHSEPKSTFPLHKWVISGICYSDGKLTSALPVLRVKPDLSYF
jgi:hypothetical protein